MKVFVFWFLFAVSSLNVFSEIYPDRIIIKFRTGSVQYAQWSAHSRTSEIPELIPLIGKHTTQPYINDNLVAALNQKEKKTDKTLSSTGIQPLSLIAVVRFPNAIDPVLISKKLSSLPWVEYAEPMPLSRIFSIPDDPKINGQYYLDTIYVFPAWDFIDSSKSIVVGVVDTGIDYYHEDILQNMFINPGEDGLDSLGRDKRTNGIDDDHNGFIDDWKGWDFGSSDSTGQDNDPTPGHKHGTHVGGTIGAVTNNGIGIASVGRYVKLMAVKASGDNPLGTSVDHGYEGILYAAIAGAKVINCSWGSATRAESEEEIVRKVIELGAIIVAAAGNNNTYETFFPAGYKGVVSVAALNSINQKASFSNYSETVDVSAPGEDILATVPNNTYEFMSGTSMASPIVAGVAALARLANPTYSPTQIHELLRVSCDNIDSINPLYKGMLGKGKIDALKAVSNKNARSVVLNSYKISEENNNGIVERNERLQIETAFENVLSPVKKVIVKVTVENFAGLTIDNNILNIGDMNTGDIISSSKNISFIIPQDIGYDEKFKVFLEISDSIGNLNTEVITFFANPSYRNLDKNNIATTVNSFGNIGFNDYPNNLQGIGFEYKGGTNILFEGALMIGTGFGKISDVARGLEQMSPDRNFIPNKFLTLDTSGIKADVVASAEYFDNSDTNRAGVQIIQSLYQSSEGNNKNFILSSYDIRNQTMKFFDSLYVGLFFDWDIGPSGANNQCDFDDNNQFGYIRNVPIDTLPMAGVAVVTDNRINYYAIDNGGTSDGNGINIYNGFTLREKWTTLSSGLFRKKSSVTDASMVYGAGPIKLLAGDTTRVTFAIFSGYNVDELRTALQNARDYADKIGVSTSNYPKIPGANTITALYPNPVTKDNVKIEYTIVDSSYARIELYDSMGRLAGALLDEKEIPQGRHELFISTNNLSSGIYYIILRTSTNTQFAAFCKLN